MKTLKRTLVIGMIVMALGTISFSVAAASSYENPAQALAALTGRSEESLVQDKSETGKTYGALAAEEGKLEEFKQEMLAIKKDRLDEKVAEGILTQEESDEILARVSENQEDCDGTGNAQQNREMAGTFGQVNGDENRGQGSCDGTGGQAGSRDGKGFGNGMGSGECKLS